MANRYWVGGTGNWNTTDTTHWSASSGGSGGASVPSSLTDDVFLDGNSGTGIITTTATVGMLSLDCTNYTGTLNLSSSITSKENFKLYSGMTLTGNGSVTMIGTGTYTVTFAGKTLYSLTCNGLGATVTFADNAYISNNFALNNVDTFTAQGDVTCGYLGVGVGGAQTVNMGSGLWTLTREGGLIWDIPATATINKGTANIKITSSLTADIAFKGGGKSYNELWIATTGIYFTAISNSNLFTNLKISPSCNIKFKGGDTQTVAGVDIVGTFGNEIVLAFLTNGGVLAITIMNGGSGYSTTGLKRYIYLTGGDGLCRLNITVSGGVVTGASIPTTSVGSGYVAGTTYDTTNPNGTGVNCTVRVDTIDAGIWTISDSAGTNTVEYAEISNSTASGGATWKALNSTNGGGNTGWVFTPPSTAQAGFLFNMI